VLLIDLSETSTNPGALLSLLAADSRNIAEFLPNSFKFIWLPLQFLSLLNIIVTNKCDIIFSYLRFCFIIFISYFLFVLQFFNSYLRFCFIQYGGYITDVDIGDYRINTTTRVVDPDHVSFDAAVSQTERFEKQSH
jgi:hypothetical protein